MSKKIDVITDGTAAVNYTLAKRRGDILPFFPDGLFGQSADEFLEKNKVAGAWREHKAELFEEARQKYPTIKNTDRAIKTYFQLKHLNPGLLYQKRSGAHNQKEEAMLTFPVYGTENYVSFEIEPERIKEVLEREIAQVMLQRQDPIGKVADGIPSQLLDEAYQALVKAQDVFESVTGRRLDVPKENSKDAMDEFYNNAHMIYLGQYASGNPLRRGADQKHIKNIPGGSFDNTN